MKKLIGLLIIVLAVIHVAPGQDLTNPGVAVDDGRLATSTKQVNQFIRRFNAEEDEQGRKLGTEEERYRSTELRKTFIEILFDRETSEVPNQLKREFMEYVTSTAEPRFLNFHQGDDWFAEVATVFNHNGKKENVTLYLKLQPEGLGHEWMIDKVSFDQLKKFFNKPKGSDKAFLHPLSHELGFMNLRKAFQNNDQPESYTPTEYKPDYLTLFLYEIKKGTMKFETVMDVKFHFFQIDNWYFELNQFNRPGFNTGWLISNLIKLEDGDKQVVLDYIYDQD